jgi:hypothetical protein
LPEKQELLAETAKEGNCNPEIAAGKDLNAKDGKTGKEEKVARPLERRNSDPDTLKAFC